MKRKMIALILSVFMIVAMAPAASFAEADSSDIYAVFEYCKADFNEYTDDFGMQADVTTYADSSVSANNALILYVINHCGEYPGTESDQSIIADLLAEGFVVSVIDYKNNPLAVSPNIESSVQVLRNEMKTGKYIGSCSIDEKKTYVVPAGYRIARNLTYFEISKHSSQEAIDKILDVWNNDATMIKRVSEKGYNLDENGNWIKADSVYDIVMKDGTKMTDEDMELKLDIIYPSKPVSEVPVAVLASSGTPRSDNSAFVERQHTTGFMFRGYATACYDHEYLPFLNLDMNGWPMINDYTFQKYDGVKTHTAAMRCIKYYADKYKYSDTKIGVYGHSKASWCSLLSNPDSENLPENSNTACAPLGEQPFLTDMYGNPINADVTCVYHSMGNGSRRFDKYLTNQNVPTMIALVQQDTGDGCQYWENEKAAYLKSGIEYLALDMEDIGHNYPNGDDTVYDYNRYSAFCKFFDYYLKDTAPEILYTSVNDGQLKAIKTTTAQYSASDTANHWKVIEGDKLFVQFVAPVTEWTFLDAVSLKDSNGNEVAGEWYAEGNGNRWVFGGKLTEGESYTLSVADNTVKDKYGRVAEKGITAEFVK